MCCAGFPWAFGLPMKYSLGISNFLEEISSLSHAVVFLYFFALIAEEGFLISPCSSLELGIQMLIFFLFSFAFHFSSFHGYLQGLLRQPFCFFSHFFSMGLVLIPVSRTMSRISFHSSSGTLSIRSGPLNPSHTQLGRSNGFFSIYLLPTFLQHLKVLSSPCLIKLPCIFLNQQYLGITYIHKMYPFLQCSLLGFDKCVFS